jgi:hypothetical protein
MTVAMGVVGGVLMLTMMVGMMFGMHRGHKKHKDKGGEKPPAVSTTTAPGGEPAPTEHSH